MCTDEHVCHYCKPHPHFPHGITYDYGNQEIQIGVQSYIFFFLSYQNNNPKKVTKTTLKKERKKRSK